MGKNPSWFSRRLTRESRRERYDFAKESSVMMPLTVSGMKGELLKRVGGICSCAGSMYYY